MQSEPGHQLDKLMQHASGQEPQRVRELNWAVSRHLLKTCSQSLAEYRRPLLLMRLTSLITGVMLQAMLAPESLLIAETGTCAVCLQSSFQQTRGDKLLSRIRISIKLAATHCNIIWPGGLTPSTEQSMG